jgi:hypothetical protein
MPVDTVQDLPDQTRPGDGTDPEQGRDLQAEVFRNPGGAVGAVVDQSFRGLSERVLIDGPVGQAQLMDGFQLHDLGGNQ